MSATYEPFTPANGSDRYRAEGRGRTSWDSAHQEPAPERQDRPQQDPWAASAQDQWAQPDRWSQPDQWSQDQAYQQPAYQQPAYQQPAYQQQAYQPAGARQAEQQPYQPAPQQSPWPAQPQQPQQPHQWQQGQQWSAPRTPTRAESKATRGFRSRPLIIGLVAALLAVSGWQAFRVESMINTSSALADAVAGSQDRTQDLERQLAKVFDSEGISAAALPSVFRVRAGEFTGTAFAVGQTDGGETNLFTNYHVIEEVFKSGDRQVSLERGSTRIEATIIKVAAAKDLALLRTDREIKGLAPASGEVKPGQQVVVIGAPLGLDDSVTTGVISAYRPDDQAGPTIQFDAPINPGNSGGPVVNSSRQVVGIATAKARDAEGIGLAIPIGTACDTMDVCGDN